MFKVNRFYVLAKCLIRLYDIFCLCFRVYLVLLLLFCCMHSIINMPYLTPWSSQELCFSTELKALSNIIFYKSDQVKADSPLNVYNRTYI